MKSNLLPNFYKTVGLCVFSLAFVVPIIMGMLHQQSWEQTEGRRQIANAVMLIGLLVLILSKEKTEDEFINHCRLTAFRAAFITGIIYFLQDAFGTFNGNLVHSSFGLLIMEIGVYMVIFYISKAGWLNGK
jgi:hypothetical protein